MDFSLIIAGISIGLAMAAPVGPVNLVVIRTALNSGFRAAFLAGLGAVGILLSISRRPDPWRWSDQRRREKPRGPGIAERNDKAGGKKNVRRIEPVPAAAM